MTSKHPLPHHDTILSGTFRSFISYLLYRSADSVNYNRSSSLDVGPSGGGYFVELSRSIIIIVYSLIMIGMCKFFVLTLLLSRVHLQQGAHYPDIRLRCYNHDF